MSGVKVGGSQILKQENNAQVTGVEGPLVFSSTASEKFDLGSRVGGTLEILWAFDSTLNGSRG